MKIQFILENLSVKLKIMKIMIRTNRTYPLFQLQFQLS